MPIEAKILPAAGPQQSVLPPPMATFKPPPPTFVPPPEVRIAKPPPPPAHNTAITNATPERPVAPAPPRPEPTAPHQVVSVLPHIDFADSHQPEYPPASRRLGEEGTVLLQVLVDASGRAVDVKVLKSSGSLRLDQAAVVGVKQDYRFVPGTVDGKPSPMQYTFKFTWKLE